MEFTKPSLDYNQLLDHLIDRGLEVDNKDRAIRYLKHIGYYRLNIYSREFQKEHGYFISGTKFNHILKLYVFDRHLRVVLMDAMERVEVAFRSAISNFMSIEYGNQWYSLPEHFGKRYGAKGRKPFNHPRLMQEIEKADSPSLRHFRKKYAKSDTPPSWVVFEVLSFGQVSQLFSHMKKREVSKISSEFDLPPLVCINWLQGVVILRNLVAHHERIWNRDFTHSLIAKANIPSIIKSSIFDPAQESRAMQSRKFYAYACVVCYFLSIISPRSSWKTRFKELVESHPTANLQSMGFSEGWTKHDLWN